MAKVRCYRGLSWAPVAEIVRQLSDPSTESIYLGMNPVSEWTTDRKYADRYAWGVPSDELAGVVVSLDVPVERIVYAAEATRELEKGEAPVLLICSGFEEVFSIPRQSIEVLKRERSPWGEEFECPDPCVITEVPGMKNPIVEIDNEVDAYTWLMEAEYLMKGDMA